MWLGNAVTSSTLLADPPSNETIDVFYTKRSERGRGVAASGFAPSVLLHRYLLVACVLRGIFTNFRLGQTADMNVHNTGDFGFLLRGFLC